MAAGISCREIVETITAYLEDGLAAPQHAQFERHLAKCDGCRAYLQQMRTTIATAGQLREDALDEGARDHLLALFREWKAG